MLHIYNTYVVLYTVSAIIFAVGPYRCAAVNSCDVCKAHFDAVNFYFSNGVNPVSIIIQATITIVQDTIHCFLGSV